jgi:hypothetical protein
MVGEAASRDRLRYCSGWLYMECFLRRLVRLLKVMSRTAPSPFIRRCWLGKNIFLSDSRGPLEKHTNDVVHTGVNYNLT